MILTQARLNRDPIEHVIFIYDGAPAHNNPAIPGPNSELKKLPSHSPFLNIVEQDISALIKSSHKSVHKSSRAARTDEQQRRDKTTRNRVRQFLHSVAPSHPAEKHWHYRGC